MSWKSIVITGLLCVVASPVLAVPSLVVTPSQQVNGDGNRVWTVQVLPEGGDLPGSLAVELPFTHEAGASTTGVGIIDGDADNTNGPASDTWYFNETSAGSGTILWNITDPADAGDEEQNTGNNPFTATVTEGLYVNGADLFAALGSTLFAGGTSTVDTLQIVTDGGGGVLHLGDAILAQNSVNTAVAAQNFYVPGDFSGDGRVGSDDVTALILNFGLVPSPDFAGDQPNAGSGIVGSGDVTDLILNFNAGQTFGSGSLAASAVPEPMSVSLVLMTASAAAFIRRRK